MIHTHETVPDFELPGTAGTDITPYRLSDHTSDGPVVLVFSPFEFSPVCTDVLCNFRDAEFLTFTDDVDVFGVSLDGCYAHRRFIDEYDLPFPLLSDSTGEVTGQFGLADDEVEHHQGVPKRVLVTVDDERTVRYRWHTDDAYESPSPEELHRTVTSLSEAS